MREIKFRAWDTENNCYLEHGFDFRIDGDGQVYRRTWGESVWDRAMNLIPEQFTGLKDKNGKEIYGGDIVRYMDGKNMEVFYSPNGYAGWKLRRKPNHGKGLLVYGLYNHEGESGAEEIIGNIHESPKLMEKL